MKRLDSVLVVTDLDGTLYKSQHDIPQQNLDALKRFRDLGGKFTVATGRSVATAKFCRDAFDIDIPVIVNNGHTLYDYTNEKIVFSEYLPEEIKEYCRKLLDKFPHAGFEAYHDREVYMMREGSVTKRHLAYEGVPYVVKDFEDAAKVRWQKLLVADEAEYIGEIGEYAKTIKPDGIDIIFTSPLYMEATAVGVNKGTAMNELAREMNIPHQNVYAIGNYYNDREMILAAGCGAYVADSPPDLIAEAAYVCSKGCADGGFAEFIDYIINR